MRVIYAVLILLLILMTSAQCQQTAQDWINKGDSRSGVTIAYQLTADKLLLNNSSPSTEMKNLDLNQFLDTIAARLFSILKICITTLLLLAVIFIFFKIYTQEGTVILPFEISNISLSGIAIADQLTAELIRIQQIHAVKYEDSVLKMKGDRFITKFSTEQSLGSRQLVVPKAEIAEFNMVDMGNIDIGVGSLSLGKLMMAFKNICPGSKPVATIRGSVQRYGSTITLVAMIESRTIQSWILRRTIEYDNEKQLQEMIMDLASMIACDLQRSGVSAKTWEGLEYYTEALDAYHQYNLSGDPDFLSLAGNYSLKAIRSERRYKNPYDLLSLLEFTYITIGRQTNAIEYCDKTIELDHTLPYACHNKGRVLCVLGKYDEAINAFDKAIEIDPKYALAWNGKGVALFKLGQNEQALEAYGKAIEVYPQYEDAWNNKGLALKLLNRTTEANDAFAKARELGYTD